MLFRLNILPVKKSRKDGGVTDSTAAFILACARRLVRWLSPKRVGVEVSLFDTIPGLDAENSRKQLRRRLTFEELGSNLELAKASTKIVRDMAGRDRYHLYLTGAYTGLRAGELAILTPAHFNLDAEYPTITLPARKSKNRKLTYQPIPSDVAVALRFYRADRSKDQPIWPGQWRGYASELMSEDLESAKIPYCIESVNGQEYADFHALRHTYSSELAAMGTGTKELQTLVRHSDPRLTLGI